jgi:hypothetical protein
MAVFRSVNILAGYPQKKRWRCSDFPYLPSCTDKGTFVSAVTPFACSYGPGSAIESVAQDRCTSRHAQEPVHNQSRTQHTRHAVPAAISVTHSACAALGALFPSETAKPKVRQQESTPRITSIERSEFGGWSSAYRPTFRACWRTGDRPRQ